MRNVKIQNGDGGVMDITSKSLFLSGLDGLGYEADESYWRIGQDYILLSKEFKQKGIQGTLMFIGCNPYREYQKFLQFAAKTPLTLLYRPYETDDTYYRKISITTAEKKELDLTGVLNIPVRLTPLTPWYRPFSIQSFEDSFEFV